MVDWQHEDNWIVTVETGGGRRKLGTASRQSYLLATFTQRTGNQALTLMTIVQWKYVNCARWNKLIGNGWSQTYHCQLRSYWNVTHFICWKVKKEGTKQCRNNETCVLLGYYAASSVNSLPTIRDNRRLFPPCFISNQNALYCCLTEDGKGFLTLEDGTNRLPQKVGVELPLLAA
jgi:hypothetical protein